MTKIPVSFYQNDDVELIAKSLLGSFLYSRVDNIKTGGIITETEAYKGVEDKASHSYGGKRTSRTEIMYGLGGISYVYLCYGVHYLLNVVTSRKNIPHAVLIRGIFATDGINKMLERTDKITHNYKLTNGPGKLTKALGLNKLHNGIQFDGDVVWIEDRGLTIEGEDIIIGPRIGVDYAEEDAQLPYRYELKYNNYIKKTP